MAKKRPRIAPRKPAVAANKAAQRFVETGRAQPGAHPSDPRAPDPLGEGVPPSAVRGASFTRADGRELKRVTAYVPETLHKRFQRLCFERGSTISDEVARLIKKLVGD